MQKKNLKKLNWLLCCFIFLLSCTNSKNFTQDVIGFTLPNNMEKLVDDKQFYNNPTGDGEQLVVFSFLSKDSLQLVDSCRKYNYANLPIQKAKLPDGSIYQWITESDSSGHYKLTVDTVDNMSYSIAVINFSKKKIIAYRVFY
jgi:hypothetical protein